MRILDERLNLMKSSSLVNRINLFFGINNATKTERFFSFTLLAGSILLTIASLYTTIKGLGEYIPFLFSIFVGIGIQSLLITASWRIGSNLYTKKTNTSIIAIYILTFITSVFFSYTALLDNIYSKENRDKDEYERGIVNGTKLTSDLVDFIKEGIKKPGDSILIQLANANKKANSYIDTKYAPLKEDYENRNQIYLSQIDKLNREIHKGITAITTSNNQTVFSDSGRGSIAIEYENSAQKYYFTNLSRLASKIKLIDSLKNKFNQAYNNLSTSTDYLNLNNLNNYTTAFSSLNSELPNNISEDSSKIISDGILEKISQLDRFNNFLSWYRERFNLLTNKTLDEVKNQLFLFLTTCPLPNSHLKKQESFRSITNLGKYGGSKVHAFTLSLYELSNFNPLAFASLFFALTIDILILFCGIIGSKPDSFLKMKNIDNLEEVQQYAMELVLALDTEIALNYNDVYIKRIAEILKAIKPSLLSAKEGFPGIIDIKHAEDLNITKELSVFIAFKLVKKLKDGSGIAISTRLLLWLIEQIVTYEIDNNLNDFKPKIK